MATAVDEPMLQGGLPILTMIDGACVGMAVRGLAPLDRDVRGRPGILAAAAGNGQALGDHLLAVEWVYRSVSIAVKDDRWDNPLAHGQPAGAADSHAANRYRILAHHGDCGW